MKQEHVLSRYTKLAPRYPVCGMEVDKAKSAGSSTHSGKTYYFCSDGCKSEFDENLEKYGRNG